MGTEGGGEEVGLKEKKDHEAAAAAAEGGSRLLYTCCIHQYASLSSCFRHNSACASSSFASFK